MFFLLFIFGAKISGPRQTMPILIREDAAYKGSLYCEDIFSDDCICFIALHPT